MGKKDLVKRIFAGSFYASGILFALYIFTIILIGDSRFHTSALIIRSMGVVYIPIALATFILISTTH